MSMSIGSAFSFNFCSETNGSLPLPTVFDKTKKKPKSPSTKRRDLVRLAAFRNKKATSPARVPLAPGCSPLDLPKVTQSQKEFHVPSTSTSFDRRSPDMDANVPEDLSVPPQPTSRPPSYPQPGMRTTPRVFVPAIPSLALVSPQNLCHPLCPSLRSRKRMMGGKPASAGVKTAISLS